MANSAKRDSRAIDVKERTRKALELRKAGASYDQIAEKLGYADGSNVRRAVMGAIEEITEEPAKEVLKLELSRLDAMLLGLYQKAKSGDAAAVDRVIRIMDRRAKYLGLDAPEKSELTGKDGAPLNGAIFLPPESDD